MAARCPLASVARAPPMGTARVAEARFRKAPLRAPGVRRRSREKRTTENSRSNSRPLKRQKCIRTHSVEREMVEQQL